MLPKDFKTCRKSNKSPNLVTLDVEPFSLPSPPSQISHKMLDQHKVSFLVFVVQLDGLSRHLFLYLLQKITKKFVWKISYPVTGVELMSHEAPPITTILTILTVENKLTIRVLSVLYAVFSTAVKVVSVRASCMNPSDWKLCSN